MMVNLLQNSGLIGHEGGIVYVQSTGDWLQIDSTAVEGYVLIPSPPYPEFPHYMIRGPEPLYISLDKHAEVVREEKR